MQSIPATAERAAIGYEPVGALPRNYVVAHNGQPKPQAPRYSATQPISNFPESVTNQPPPVWLASVFSVATSSSPIHFACAAHDNLDDRVTLLG